jgi:nucleotidyltransferase substrate binding protein (TIGR01987 family)
MIINLSPLQKALAQLESGLTFALSHSDNELARDGVIQRFEYTYELSHKMLKRFMENTEASSEMFDAMTFQDLIRLGNEKGLLLNGWDEWRTYRTARGTTSHTYDKEKAIEVFEVIPGFVEEARYLLQMLETRNQ